VVIDPQDSHGYGIKECASNVPAVNEISFKWTGSMYFCTLSLSTTTEHHLALLREVLAKLTASSLKLKRTRWQLFQASVVFLGHEVSASGARPDPANTEKVAMWKTPKTRVNCAASFVLGRIMGNSVPTLPQLLSHCNV